MAGYILILAIIILGGAIATVGDRIGSRVGKARLSLFNLRPRTTAILVTILTGSVISASTLGVLLSTSKELRDGVLRIESIQRQQRQVEAELSAALQQKEEIQKALAAAKTELGDARDRLLQVNQSLNQAIARQRKTQSQLNQLQARFLTAQRELQQFSQQSKALRAEIIRLQAEAQTLQAERERLIAQRNQVVGRLKQAENQKQALETSVAQARSRLNQVESQKQKLESAVSQSQTRLQQAEQRQAKLAAAVNQAQTLLKQADSQRAELLKQQTQLRNEVSSLEASRKRLQESVDILLLGLRRGNITIRAGQVLASGLVQGVKDRQTALQAVQALLREARKNTIILTNPQKITPEQQVVQPLRADIERLVQQLMDGQTYFVRILAAGNYLEGETAVLIVPQVARNQVVFSSGEQVATVTLNPSTMTDDQILSRLDYLFTISNQRAIQSGILPDPLTGSVGSFRQIDLIKFVLELKQYQGDIDVAAIAPQTVYTSGPLKLELIALRNQRVILKSS